MRLSSSIRSLVLALALFVPLAARPALAQDASPTPDAAAPASGETAGSATSTIHRPNFWERMRAQAQTRGPTTELLTSALSSVGFGPELLWGGGLQLRLDHYPTGLPLRIGGFVQSEVLTDGAVRVAGGMQGGAWFMGCQMGLAYRFQGDRSLASLGLQLGKTIDFGIFSIGGRVVIPLADFSFGDSQSTTSLRSPGVEGAIFMSVGLPTLLEGERRGCGCDHGRRDTSEEEDGH